MAGANTLENMEEIFTELTRFESIARPMEIPRLLEDYLVHVAKTGDPVFPWPKVRPLIKHKLDRIIGQFCEDTPPDKIPGMPNVDPFTFDELKQEIHFRIDSLNGTPFTVQRLCELLTEPRKYYKRIDKFMRGVEKNVLVVTTIESTSRHRPAGQPTVNGAVEPSSRSSSQASTSSLSSEEPAAGGATVARPAAHETNGDVTAGQSVTAPPAEDVTMETEQQQQPTGEVSERLAETQAAVRDDTSGGDSTAMEVDTSITSSSVVEETPSEGNQPAVPGAEPSPAESHPLPTAPSETPTVDSSPSPVRETPTTPDTLVTEEPQGVSETPADVEMSGESVESTPVESLVGSGTEPVAAAVGSEVQSESPTAASVTSTMETCDSEASDASAAVSSDTSSSEGSAQEQEAGVSTTVTTASGPPAEPVVTESPPKPSGDPQETVEQRPESVEETAGNTEVPPEQPNQKECDLSPAVSTSVVMETETETVRETDPVVTPPGQSEVSMESSCEVASGSEVVSSDPSSGHPEATDPVEPVVEPAVEQPAEPMETTTESRSSEITPAAEMVTEGTEGKEVSAGDSATEQISDKDGATSETRPAEDSGPAEPETQPSAETETAAVSCEVPGAVAEPQAPAAASPLKELPADSPAGLSAGDGCQPAPGVHEQEQASSEPSAGGTADPPAV